METESENSNFSFPMGQVGQNDHSNPYIESTTVLSDIGRAEKGRDQYNIIPVSGADPPADYDTDCHNDNHCQNSEQRSGYGNGHYLRVTLPFLLPPLSVHLVSQ